MAVPTVPSVSTILTEAFRRCGIIAPTVAQLTRAEDEWLEETKQELYTEKRWHNLEDTQQVATVAGTQSYTTPSPLYRILRMKFVDASGFYSPMVQETNIKLLGTGQSPVSAHWEEFENTFYAFPTPSLSTCFFEIDGIVDISLIDETDARLTRVLREWRPALLYGVMLRVCQDKHDYDFMDRIGDVDGTGLYGLAAKRLMRNDARKRRSLTPAEMQSPGGMPRRRY